MTINSGMAYMIAPQEFNNMVIGKTVAEATDNLQRAGYTLQVASQDGEHFMLQTNIDSRRVRVDVVAGRVTAWTVG